MHRIYAKSCILRHGEMYNWCDFKYEIKHHFNILMRVKWKALWNRVLYNLKIDSRTKHNDAGQNTMTQDRKWQPTPVFLPG